MLLHRMLAVLFCVLMSIPAWAQMEGLVRGSDRTGGFENEPSIKDAQGPR